MQINVSSTVMCDVNVGRRMVFGSEERREQMRKRENITEIIREEREISGKIISLELHCSSIAN